LVFCNNFVFIFIQHEPRKKAKAEPDTAPQEVLSNLNGEWRLVFTTGTKESQEKFGAKINYFPIKVNMHIIHIRNP